jgi:hypothetical protein
MRHVTTRRVGYLLAIVLAVQVSGCGTLLYPERKGQKDGRLDTTVVLLDGVGLLFFIIPGLIAFLVDFNNGTIYLPGTAGEHGLGSGDGHSSLTTPDGTRWITAHVGPGRLDAATIRAVVGEKTGVWLALDDPRLQVLPVERGSDLPVDEVRGRSLASSR